MHHTPLATAHRTPSTAVAEPWPGVRGYAAHIIAGLIALLLLSMAAPQASAQRREDPLAGLDRRDRVLFQRYTRLFCAQFFRYGDNRYVILPNYVRRRENSSGLSYDQATEMMVEIVERKTGLGTVKDKVFPPTAEVIARAKVLPAIDVGHYGFVNAFRIQEIVGPDEMIVRDIELIPEQVLGDRGDKNTYRRERHKLQEAHGHDMFRLLGFETKGLRVGQEYKGPRDKGMQIAVMSTDPKHAYVLVNYDKLDRVRTHEFADVLKYVKLSPLAFNDMVRDNRERLKSDGDKASLIAIYRRFYDRYRPSRVSKEAPQIAVGPETAPPPKTETDEGSADPGDGQDEGGEQESPTDTEAPEADTTPADDGVSDPEPRPAPEDSPGPDDTEDEDDWEYEEDKAPDEDDVDFFGIPLD